MMKKNIFKIIHFFTVASLLFTLSVSGQSISSSDKNEKTTNSDSVVHLAYRSAKREDLLNAVSILKPTEYLDKNYGVYPLEGADALVAGSNLWNIGTPLILIDGVPRSLNDITSSEIDQISFLKGANAVVLYGSRAANGVILITTKRGSAGTHESNIRVNSGVNLPKAYPKFLGSAEYMKYYNQASVNDGLPAMYSDSTINSYASHSDTYRYPDVNYFSSDYLRKLFNTYSATAEFSSGTEKARFYAEAGFQNQNSLLDFGEGKNERNTRLNLRGNIDLKLNKYISTYVNVSTVFNTNRSALGNFWQLANTLQPQRFSPLLPINMIANSSKTAITLVNDSRNLIDGQYLLGGTQQNLTNPIADIYAGGYNVFTSRQFQYTNGIDVDMKNVLKGLTFHTQISIDYSNSYNESVNNTYAIYVPTWSNLGGSDSIVSLIKYNKDSRPGTQNLSNTWSDQLTDLNFHFDYVRTFKEHHNLSVVLLADGLRRRQTGDFQYRTNANLGLDVSYNFSHKYFAEFGGALVNSTKLPLSERAAFSPTLNLGWVLSEEKFLKNSKVIDRLKIGASAGIINTDLDLSSYYLYDAVYTSSAYYSWADGTYTNRATTISRGDNPNLTFAKRKEINLTVEASLFQKKLEFLSSVFLIQKDGIPIQSNTLYPTYFYTSYPPTSFIPYTNFEANSYRGLDFQLNYHKKAGNVNLIFGVAGSYIVTRALKRDELYTDTYRNRAGKPIDAIFGLQSEGLFLDQNDINSHAVQKFGTVKPGDIKYKDQNGDGIIDERDEVMLGKWGSPFTGGLNFTAEWKDFTLFILGTGAFGGTGIKSGSYYWVSGANKYSDVVRNSWTDVTKNTATYPRLTTLSGDNNFRYSDFWAYSTNRFNLSKVQLTYNFSNKILKNSFIKALAVYVSGNDLLTISKNRKILELNIGTMPQVRFYNFGIKGDF